MQKKTEHVFEIEKITIICFNEPDDCLKTEKQKIKKKMCLLKRKTSQKKTKKKMCFLKRKTSQKKFVEKMLKVNKMFL